MAVRHAKNIALTEQLQGWIDSLVESGEYQDASEVVRDALRTLKERREREAMALTEIRDRIRRGATEADHGAYAAGSGEAAVRRAFETGLKRAGS